MKSFMTTSARAIGLLAALGFSAAVQAAGGGAALETPIIDSSSTKSLQRGAQTYMNYCMGCHGLGYHRYNRTAMDLGLSDEDMSANLIFAADETGEQAKVGSLMSSAMSLDFGKTAFGVAPPDLSLITRSRGVDWVYTYLKSFYVDPERGGVGINNTVFPGVGMPHVLWELQGLQRAVYHTETVDGEAHEVFSHFEPLTDGKLSPAEYDDLVADLTNFLSYVADPYKAQRHRMGFITLLVLFVLLGLTWLLKREYWKDVH